MKPDLPPLLYAQTISAFKTMCLCVCAYGYETIVGWNHMKVVFLQISHLNRGHKVKIKYIFIRWNILVLQSKNEKKNQGEGAILSRLTNKG